MQWLTELKNQFHDPIDCLRLHIIAENKTSNLIDGRWLYSTPPSRKMILQKRRRIDHSLRKIHLVQKYQWVFRYCFPFVEFVGISGSVSSLGAKQYDDIDLFIITQPKRLGLSRLTDWLIFNLLRVRRNRQTTKKQYNNKLCCNYYLDNDSLVIVANSHNALEIAELIPIFDRKQGGNYLKLLQVNPWIKEFLPQWYVKTIKDQTLAVSALSVTRASLINLRFVIFKLLFDVLEILIGLPQQLLIKRTLPNYKTKLFAKTWQFWRSRI